MITYFQTECFTEKLKENSNLHEVFFRIKAERHFSVLSQVNSAIDEISENVNRFAARVSLSNSNQDSCLYNQKSTKHTKV